MSYAYRIMLLSCFCIGMVTINTCINKKTELSLERIKTVNNHEPHKKPVTQNKCSVTNDKYGASVIIEWKQTNLLAPDFAEAMSKVWPIARQAYTPVEMQFLKAFPDVVANENYFKPFEPLFKDGAEKVDWKLAKQTMETILKSHFVFDASLFSEEMKTKYARDICFFISVKDKAMENLLGFITFMARADYAPGDIKVISLAVDPLYQNRGLGKLLMSSIFKIAPTTKRVFLSTRVSNTTALSAYQAWGFTKDLNPILDHPFNMNHWSFLEYKIESSNSLQKVAQAITTK